MGVAVVLGVTLSGWVWGKAELDQRPAVAPMELDGLVSDVEARLLLVGDGGTLPGFRRPRARVLERLEEVVDLLPERTLTVFLGDNVYDVGMDSADISATAPRLDPQIHSVSRTGVTGVQGVFVPGNHDWSARMDARRVRTQARYVDSVSAGSAVVLPSPAGCPGPSTHAMRTAAGDTAFVLVALDTQWLLTAGAVTRETPACAEQSVEGVLEELRGLLQSTTQHVVVAGHHPLWSIGKHARDTLTVAPQNLYSAEYTTLRRRLTRTLSAAPPLIVAGGHDHSLQHFDRSTLPEEMRDAVQHVVVSGAVAKSTPLVEGRPGVGFEANGFVVVDFHTDGSVTMDIIDGTKGERLHNARLHGPKRVVASTSGEH